MFCAWRLWMRRPAALDPAAILRTSSFVAAQSPAPPANVVVILCNDQSVGDVVTFGAADIGAPGSVGSRPDDRVKPPDNAQGFDVSFGHRGGGCDHWSQSGFAARTAHGSRR